MASTLTKILLHVTFSTKNRVDLIPPEIEDDLYGYIGGICRAKKSVLLAAGGTANHAHLFINLAKTIATADLMLHVKRDTSKWLKKDDRLRSFSWQKGYFTFSLGESGTDALRAYIANQKKHHKTIGFQDEVRATLRKYKMEGDERYMWDSRPSLPQNPTSPAGWREQRTTLPGVASQRLLHPRLLAVKPFGLEANKTCATGRATRHRHEDAGFARPRGPCHQSPCGQAWRGSHESALHVTPSSISRCESSSSAAGSAG
jgi:REP element-mobilizing transposase RayT